MSKVAAAAADDDDDDEKKVKNGDGDDDGAMAPHGRKPNRGDMGSSRNLRDCNPCHCLGCHCEKEVVWRATDSRTETRTRKVGAAQVDGVEGVAC